MPGQAIRFSVFLQFGLVATILTFVDCEPDNFALRLTDTRLEEKRTGLL
jgi:hypothetical protein